MLLSVVVPTCNRPDLLQRALASLTRQQGAGTEFEVIVVDNGSSQPADEVVRRFEHTLANLRCVREGSPGLHNARHRGLHEARSRVLAYIDDDSEPGPRWVAALLEAFADPDVALVGGNNYPRFEAEPPQWLLRWWQEPVSRGRALGYLSILDFGTGSFDIDPAYVWGCNFAIRRDVLLQAGGFHPDSFPRDLVRFRGDGETHVSEVVRNCGLRAVFHSGASVFHFVPRQRMTRAYFAQRAYDQGISDSYTELRSGRRLGLAAGARWLAALVQGGARMALSGDASERELLSVRCATMWGHRAGRRFHRREVASDPALLEWVLKKDYLQ